MKRPRIFLAVVFAVSVLITVFFSNISNAVYGDIVVLYKCNNTNTTANQINAAFQVQNNSASAFVLSSVKLRYWYTLDGTQGQTFHCDYAQVGSGNITGTFVGMPASTNTADHYLEIGFGSGAGSLNPGTGSGEIQIRFNKNDWSNYTQSNDYSFNSGLTGYGQNPKVTGYVNGVLVFGTEPMGDPTQAPTVTPTITPTPTSRRNTPTPAATPLPTTTGTPTSTERTVTPTPTRLVNPTPTQRVRVTPTRNVRVTPTFRPSSTPTRRVTPTTRVVTPTQRVTPTPSGTINKINYDVNSLSVSANAKKILKYFIALSNDDIQGAIVGQNCGHGAQIADGSNTFVSYTSLGENLYATTGKYVGILGVDYEHEKIYTPAELSLCNQILINYWNSGGLITINWSPHNPWLNDETDIINHPGVWTDTRSYDTAGQYNLTNVDLTKLVDPNDPIRKVWLRKLDRIAAALLELKNAGVVVLWRPMQEMNGDWFWWGYTKNPDNPDAYKNVFIDMYNYFTNVKGLNNLLWVYSPASTGSKSFSWDYPGGQYVNVVAVTAYNDNLSVSCYQEMTSFNRPMAMAEYGGADNPTTQASGSFDNRKYINVIQTSYPMFAYFVCWHNWDNGGGNYVYHSINRNIYPSELMNNSNVITREKLNWTSY